MPTGTDTSRAQVTTARSPLMADHGTHHRCLHSDSFVTLLHAPNSTGPVCRIPISFVRVLPKRRPDRSRASDATLAGPSAPDRRPHPTWPAAVSSAGLASSAHSDFAASATGSAPRQSEVGKPGHHLGDAFGVHHRVPVGRQVQLRNAQGRIASNVSDDVIGARVHLARSPTTTR
jgi:hypothetical protein